ncbi:DUF1795 domain-containing protein [Chimaeribacter arupi]|uniref:Inner membrane lipoprotein DcrB n=2 Tax=Yersiniaceae TaxID=1903411 RepID=A0A2N5EI16_9GAMM|nr:MULTISPECIES: DcrB family lipoprotein [Yersiniaceae]MBS0971050.1 DcrB family lipoprotein [Nissabacter archeti]MDV5141767.1 DcrB family lipoprotein [Chimaeribacter arupi]PLR30327.1 DUF1795 domain-containing protein [Chimaeribacter arupi]PLR42065.1 DUF1795 domain-containing protein [Chimaeribacter arupi]PLR43276.1 DUF1795 domain-containing protein [Chimaeribacter arupi]
MRKLVKYAGIGLLVTGLAACDGNSDEKAGAAPDTDQTTTQTADGRQVNLLDGSVMFTMPGDMTDQSGKLGTQANNMHVYADESGQKAIIVLLSDNSPDGLDVLAKRLEDQQRSRDPDLQVVTNKSITVDGQPAQQLDSVIATSGKKAYSSVVLAKVANHLLTLQITLPADNQQQAQSQAESIINTLKVK